MIRDLLHRLGWAIAPGCCILCGCDSRRQLDLCAPCEASLPAMPEHYCYQCAHPLHSASISELGSPAAQLCGQCLARPPLFQRSLCGWLYQYPMRELIGGFKYRHQFSYGRVLAQLLSKKVSAHYLPSELPELLVATPLHWRREFTRGFNQSEQLCRQLSKTLNIPRCRPIRRVQATPPQQSLHAQQRRRNLRHAFRLAPNASRLLQGRRVALIDDVITTGTTANTISKQLLAAGAREVHIWGLARTPLQ